MTRNQLIRLRSSTTAKRDCCPRRCDPASSSNGCGWLSPMKGRIRRISASCWGPARGRETSIVEQLVTSLGYGLF